MNRFRGKRCSLAAVIGNPVSCLSSSTSWRVIHSLAGPSETVEASTCINKAVLGLALFKGSSEVVDPCNFRLMLKGTSSVRRCLRASVGNCSQSGG